MLNCKQASELVSQAIERRLSRRERAALRVHLLICRACRAFERQVQFLHRAARAYSHRGLAAARQWALSAQARTRIRAALARER